MDKSESKKGSKSGYFVHPLAVKQQAVEEYEQGLSSSKVICQRLGISIQALHSWRQQVRRHDGGTITRPRRSEELKLRIVRGILTRMLTLAEASAQYKVSKHAIRGWIEKYSCQLAEVNQVPMARGQEKVGEDQERIRQLERALEDANLKIIGLETMIHLAENELKIDIRKKSGTKQSNS